MFGSMLFRFAVNDKALWELKQKILQETKRFEKRKVGKFCFIRKFCYFCMQSSRIGKQ